MVLSLCAPACRWMHSLLIACLLICGKVFAQSVNPSSFRTYLPDEASPAMVALREQAKHTYDDPKVAPEEKLRLLDAMAKAAIGEGDGFHYAVARTLTAFIYTFSLYRADRTREIVDEVWPIWQKIRERSRIARADEATRKLIDSSYGSLPLAYPFYAQQALATGRLRDALIYAQRGLELAPLLKDQAEDQATLLFNAYDALGNYYLLTGNTETALDYLQKARQSAPPLPDPDAMTIEYQIGTAEMSLALQTADPTHRRQRLESAVRRFDGLIPLYSDQKDANPSDRAENANLRSIAGLTRFILGDKVKGITMMRQAVDDLDHLTLPSPSPFSLGINLYPVIANSQIASALAADGKFQEAVRFAEKSVALSPKEWGSDPNYPAVLMTAARIQAAVGHMDNADTLFRQAIDAIEKTRFSLLGVMASQQEVIEKQTGIYHSYIAFLLRHGRNADAFAVTQRVKARSLLDQLRQEASALPLADKEKQDLLDLKKAIDQANSRWTEARTAVGRANARDTLKQAESELIQYEERLFARYLPAHLNDNTRTVALKDLYRYLPEDTALLEFVALTDLSQSDSDRSGYLLAAEKDVRIVLFVVTRTGGKMQLTVHPVTLPLASCREFLTDCTSGSASVGASGKKVYEGLLAASAPRWQAKKRLIICPDGYLWRLPFAALPIGRGRKPRWLGERFEIVHNYSASTVALCRDLPKRVDRPRARRPLLIYCDPSNPPAVSDGAISRGRFGATPFAMPERDAILRRFPDATVRLHAEATASSFLAEAPEYRLIHIVSHGLANDSFPSQSFMALASDPKAGEDGVRSGLLTAQRLAHLRLAADMVVLSGCETGVVTARAGEGLRGIAWSAMFAGAPTTIASLWRVDGESSAYLIKEFYQALKTDTSGRPHGKGAALKTATNATLRNSAHPPWGHPVYWAPFILIGDWN